MSDDLRKFIEALESELTWRYQACSVNAPPDTILLAVLNAIVEAKKAASL